MTPEAQRIAIAEACPGWKVMYSQKFVLIPNWPNITDPINDLNAMHEAERMFDDRHKFTDDTRSLYYDYLALGAEGFPDRWEICWHVLRSTAAQRAEAFLRTIGKWTDD